MTITIKPEHMIAVNQEEYKSRRRRRRLHRSKDSRLTNNASKWQFDQAEYSTRRPISRDDRRARTLREHSDLAAIGIDVESCFA